MEILNCNFDRNDKVSVYKLTKSSSMMVQEAPDGLSVPVDKWALYNDQKPQKDGTVKDSQVLSFTDTAGVKYSTVSATFIREFLDIDAIMSPDPYAVILKHGKTKANKSFVTCELDCDYKA